MTIRNHNYITSALYYCHNPQQAKQTLRSMSVLSFRCPPTKHYNPWLLSPVAVIITIQYLSTNWNVVTSQYPHYPKLTVTCTCVPSYLSHNRYAYYVPWISNQSKLTVFTMHNWESIHYYHCQSYIVPVPSIPACKAELSVSLQSSSSSHQSGAKCSIPWPTWAFPYLLSPPFKWDVECPQTTLDHHRILYNYSNPK